MQVQRLDHVAITITDVPRAKAFYGGLLGLTEISRPDSFTFGGAWYRIGDIDLHLVSRSAPDAPSGRHFAFTVPDIHAAAATLEAAGHPITWETSFKIPHITRFFTTDPDHNRLEFQSPDTP